MNKMKLMSTLAATLILTACGGDGGNGDGASNGTGSGSSLPDGFPEIQQLGSGSCTSYANSFNVARLQYTVFSGVASSTVGNTKVWSTVSDGVTYKMTFTDSPKKWVLELNGTDSNGTTYANFKASEYVETAANVGTWTSYEDNLTMKDATIEYKSDDSVVLTSYQTGNDTTDSVSILSQLPPNGFKIVTDETSPFISGNVDIVQCVATTATAGSNCSDRSQAPTNANCQGGVSVVNF